MVDMYGLFTYVTGVVPLLYTVPISHLGCMRSVRNTEERLAELMGNAERNRSGT